MAGKIVNFAVVLLIVTAACVFAWVIYMSGDDEGGMANDEVVEEIDTAFLVDEGQAVHIGFEKVGDVTAKPSHAGNQKQVKQGEFEEQVQHDLEEVDPFAELKDSFAAGIQDFVELGEGGDVLGFCERMFEPGSEMHGFILEAIDHIDHLSMEDAIRFDIEIESAREELRGARRHFDELIGSWDQLHKDGNSVYFDYSEEYPQGKRYMYVVDGVWYFSPPNEIPHIEEFKRELAEELSQDDWGAPHQPEPRPEQAPPTSGKTP